MTDKQAVLTAALEAAVAGDTSRLDVRFTEGVAGRAPAFHGVARLGS